MRNIFLFIRRYFNFVFFVVLQVAALYILFHYNKFHEAVFSGVANELTGNIGGKYSNVTNYFHLKSTNDQLAKENAELRNALFSNFSRPDTTQKLVQDTVAYDTLGHFRKYLWRGARVVKSVAGDIAVFRAADGSVFALRDRCPHKGGPLSQGIVHGHGVTCPLHNWVISLETGEAQGADHGCTPKIPLQVVEGRIRLDAQAIARLAVPHG